MINLRQVRNQVTRKQRGLRVLLMEPANIPKKVLLNLTDDWQDKGWKSNWIINHKYKFVYCPIHKVATSSMAKAMLLLSDCKRKKEIIEAGDKTIRNYVFSHLTLSNYRYEEAQQILNDSTYFKFAIVRNPWSRLVSAYLDKFIINKTIAISSTKQIENTIYKQSGFQVDWQKSVNFRQFLEYIATQEDTTLNQHWRPQHLFFDGLEFNFIGKLESLRADFSTVKEKLNFDIELSYSSSRKANYSDENTNNLVSYAECHPNELKQLKKFPKYKKFYTPELAELVRQKYRKDIEMFGYDF